MAGLTGDSNVLSLSARNAKRLADIRKWNAAANQTPTLPNYGGFDPFNQNQHTGVPYSDRWRQSSLDARKRAQEYAKRYRRGQSSFLLKPQAAGRAPWANPGDATLPIGEQLRRMKAAGALTSRLKQAYRQEGLYSGNQSRDYDPLLENAGRLERAAASGDQGAVDTEVANYKKAADAQAMKAQTRLVRRAALAHKELVAKTAEWGSVERIGRSKKVLTSGLEPEVEKWLRGLTSDPMAWQTRADEVLEAQEFLAEFERQRQDAKPKGFGEHLLAGVAGVGGYLAAPIDEFIMQPYYAGKLAGNRGAGTGRRANAFLSSLPGLGFIAGGVSKRDRAAVDSYEKRAELGKAGELESFGQTFSDILLRGVAGTDINGYQPFKKMYENQSLSGPLDALLQTADPLNYTPAATARLGRVGERVAARAARSVAREEGLSLLRTSMSNTDGLIEAAVLRASKYAPADAIPQIRERITEQVAERVAQARIGFLDNTARGRGMVAQAEKVVAKNFDAASIKKAIPGIDQVVAQEMASASTKDAAVDAFRRAFVTGEYSPSMTIRRQLLGEAGSKLPSGVGLGPRVVRPSHGLFDLVTKSRRAVRGNAVRSTRSTSKAAVAAYNVLQAGLARAELRYDDAYAAVAPSVMGLSQIDRLYLVWDNISGNAALEDLFERNLVIAEKNAYASLGNAPTGPSSMQAALQSEAVETFLKQMEVIAHLGQGKAGAAAKAQVTAEAKYGLGRKARKAGTLLDDALVGVRVGAKPHLGLPADKALLQRRIMAIADPDARAALQGQADALKGNRGLAKLVAKVDSLLDSGLGGEYGRLLRNQDELVGAAEDALDPVGLMRRAANMPLRLVNSLAEPVSPAHVAFLGYANTAHAIGQRVEDVDRWARDLGFDDFTRKLMGDAVARVKSEDDLFRVIEGGLRSHAQRNGLPAELLVAIQTNGVREVREGTNKMTFARVNDGLVKTSEDVYTLAQRGEVVYLPDPDDVRRTVREFKADHGDLGAKFRVGLAKVPDLKLFGIHGPVTGDALTIRNFLVKGHRKWKYLTVIPGLELAAMGAIVGFAATDGDLGDKFKGAAQASSIGLLSPLRYVTRVAGIEEGLRKYLAGGMNAEMWKPHLARTATQSGLDRPFTLHNAVRAGDPLGNAGARRLPTNAGGWDAVEEADGVMATLLRKDARYLEGYGRILNQQIHPETDRVAEILLQRQGKEITADEAVVLFREFSQSDAGRLWLRRLKGGVNGPKNADEAFARYDEFIGHYVPDADVARARLDAARSYATDGVKVEVPKQVLKAAQRRGDALPTAIHAEKTFLVPKNFKEAAQIRDRFTRRVFEGPTTALNRVPMAKAFYRDEYTRLLRNGVEPKRAQEIAEQLAVEKTNKVMFRINDESRFAAKADFVFPFQQPREELLRVWAPLVANNPARAMHMTRLASLAFNNGKEKGMFYEDGYGEWRMAVPGSAWLSKTLFNSNSAFDFRLLDLVFFGQGAYNVNIIPSPGGPYWGAAARMFVNKDPEWFENLSPGVKEWLFPYGLTGRIFRPEVARMWQAWTGDIAPFEFASQVEQQNALDKHRIQVYRQLIWQHAQKTGDWSWVPTDEEWDEAVSASLKAWAFIGATFPAGPSLTTPDVDAIEAVKKLPRYNERGVFDYFKFINENPKFAPWMTGTSVTNDDSFEAWARTQEQKVDDTLLHRRTTKDARKWRAEMLERREESKAYKELADISNYPPHMVAEKQAMYLAWDKKYPKLADQRTGNYYRDVELMHIEGSLWGESKDRALDAWRTRYDVSYPNYQRLALSLHEGTLRSDYSPWDTARDTDAIAADVTKRLNRTTYAGTDFEAQFASEQRVVAGLPVAEQIKYWDWRLNNFDYGPTTDTELLMEQYRLVKAQRSALWKTAPMKLQRAMNPKPTDDYTAKVQEIEQGYRDQISAAYAELQPILAALEKMKAAGSWGANYRALRDRRNALYDLIGNIKDEWYKGIPDVKGAFDDLRAVMVFAGQGNVAGIAAIQKYRKEHGFFLASDEQAGYLSMPAPVKDAYVQELVNGLSLPSEGFTEGKLFWEWLSEFQQDLLSKNLPKSQVDEWKAQNPENRGSGSGGFGRGGGAGDELSYAYAMFKKYNQRGGAKPPSAYAEYLTLPNDAALRSAFLRQHPEVGEYIKLGPMANMPPVLQMLVADIMIRNGKWEGESRSMTEISEIAFAREQMARWNRRGDRKAPEALQTWLNMPTGPEKAAYMRAHPEIGEWMQLGPMANMPEAYREVVRDIMFRYQLWTDNQDPLGKVIQGYFSAPSYARDKYLEDHPELVEYWKATRSVESQAQYALADQYFSISDPNAKRAFLQVHPELQEFFLNQRQKRYENFLNQVAVYMGSNPELFTAYLDRQEAVLADLLHKFSEAPMMRERYVMRDSTAKDRRAAA